LTTQAKTLSNEEQNTMGFREGLVASVPIAIGFLPIAITFGVIAKAAELTLTQALAMSLFVFAGASQFVGVNLIVLGVPFAEIVLTTFFLNFRHFLMSSFLATKFLPMSKTMLAVVGFGITDETFSMASIKDGKLSGQFMLGLNFLAYSAWASGTALGVLLATGIPASVQASMGIALYAMFIGLLVPNMKKSFKIAIVAISAGIANTVLSQFLSIGWSIIGATLIGAIVGTLLSDSGHSSII